MAGGGSNSGGSSTVTQVQQIPQWQQDYAQQNEQIAAQLAARPYQTYQGQMVAGFTPQQQQGVDMAGQASTAYQPYLNQATQATQQAANSYQPYYNAAGALTANGSQTWGQASPQQQAAYMNPYVMQSLAPQLQQLDIQQRQNQLGINRQSTQAGAYGDARQGVAQSLNDFYGQLARNDLIGQGMNNAYASGMQAYNTGQQQQLTAGAQMGNLGNAVQQSGLNTAQAYAGLGQQAQDQGLAGSNALFQSGTQQQQLNQQQLNLAYQNYMNQQNYPIEMLNLRMNALSNSPYNTASLAVQPPSNASASNLGSFAALSGLLGNLGGSGGSNSGVGGNNIWGSDIRIKRDIVHVGTTKKMKLPVYAFRYLWDDQLHIGVMAQDVEKIAPEAVLHDAAGFKAVDYSKVH